MRCLLSAVILATSVGCASVVTGEGFEVPPKDANFGQPPEVGENVKSYFALVLKDPESARYRKGHVGKAHCNKGLAWGGEIVWYGYAANIYINAKNSFGGYTGFKPYTLLWNPDGTIKKHIANDDFGNSSSGPGLCRWENGQIEMSK